MQYNTPHLTPPPGFLFTEGIIKAIKGEPVVQCAFVESTLTPAKFFASPVKFGKDGIEEVRHARLCLRAPAWVCVFLPFVCVCLCLAASDPPRCYPSASFPPTSRRQSAPVCACRA